MIAITNGRVILPDTRTRDGHFTALPKRAVLIEDGRILDIVTEAHLKAAAPKCQIIDAGGRYISPGFINIHIHGCFGADTMDMDAEAIPKMRQGLPSMGVTSFCPTTMTCPVAEIQQALVHIRDNLHYSAGSGAEVLGAYLEGPFISAAHKGAQDEKNILAPDFRLIEHYTDAIRYLALAPEELRDNWHFAELCRDAGIKLSLGHTSATYEQAAEAYCHGIEHATHLYNAMTPFHHRKPGVVGAVFDHDFTAELIADGIHAHAAAQRLAWKLKGPDHLVLITDSLRACGLGDGESELGGQKVFVKGQLATLADGTIAASVASMDHVVRTFAESTGEPISRVVELVTRVPARELGCEKERGSLEHGKLANITIFDDNVNIYATFVRGTLCYQAK